jgi:hypothetical protein
VPSFFDDFQSSSLRTDLWSVVLEGGSHAASYRVGGGSLVLLQRPIIRTRARLSSVANFPIVISGSITFDHHSDFFQFYTRTNAIPSGFFKELSDGISFYIGTGHWGDADTPQLTLRIKITGSSSDQAVAVSSSYWAPQVGVMYNYRIVDAGTHAHIYIDNKLLLVHSSIPASFMPGHYIAMYNRETLQAQTSLGAISISVGALAKTPAPSSSMASAPPPAPTPLELSQSASSESSETAANPAVLIAAILGALAFAAAVCIAAFKLYQRRKNCVQNAPLVASHFEVVVSNGINDWGAFVSKLDVDARLFVSDRWNANIRQACGVIVHTELNPFLDKDGPVVANFRSGIDECGADGGEFLWHGTSEENILPICAVGFNPDLRNQQAHGPGEYFARSAATSYGYTRDNGSGMRRFILCYVLKQTKVVGGDIIVVDNPPTSSRRSYVLPVLVVTFSNNAPNPPLNCTYSSPFGSHRIMYHQTSDAAATAIMRQGFDMSKAASGLAGEGIYFATHPKSTFHKAKAGRGSIIRVTLNVGISFITGPSPGAINYDMAVRPLGYLSVKVPRNDWNHDATENGAEYVVYNACQAQPHAVMPSAQYARISACAV